MREALSLLSYTPSHGSVLTALRDKGSNLDLHVQSVVSCRLDDPGSAFRSEAAPLRPSPRGEIDAAGDALRRVMVVSSVSPVRSRTMFSMPLAYPSTLDHRPPVAISAAIASYVEELWSPSLTQRWKFAG